jgi:hypothetical protein
MQGLLGSVKYANVTEKKRNARGIEKNRVCASVSK